MYSSRLSGQAGEVHGQELLARKGKTVGALIHSGIALMCANFDLVQRAVVLQIAMMGALTDGAFNCLVCIAVHFFNLPYRTAQIV